VGVEEMLLEEPVSPVPIEADASTSAGQVAVSKHVYSRHPIDAANTNTKFAVFDCRTRPPQATFDDIAYVLLERRYAGQPTVQRFCGFTARGARC
jgi:hypothetical protein